MRHVGIEGRGKDGGRRNSMDTSVRQQYGNQGTVTTSVPWADVLGGVTGNETAEKGSVLSRRNYIF